MIPQLFKTKLTAGVIAVTFCSAGVAAAATGGLPGPLQRGLDRAAEVVGHEVPPTHDTAADDEMDDHDGSSTTTSTTESTENSTSTTKGSSPSTSAPGSSTTEAVSDKGDETSSSTDGKDDMDDEDADHEQGDDEATPVGPDANGPAKKGLCNAYMHSVAKGHSQNAGAVAFQNLAEAADAAGQTVEEFCATGTPAKDHSSTTASSMPSTSSSMPSTDDDDDDDMTSTSAKTHGNSADAGTNGKHGKP